MDKCSSITANNTTGLYLQLAGVVGTIPFSMCRISPQKWRVLIMEVTNGKDSFILFSESHYLQCLKNKFDPLLQDSGKKIYIDIDIYFKFISS